MRFSILDIIPILTLWAADRFLRAPLAFLTVEAALALKKASDDLAEQYDAYRPQTAVEHFKGRAEDPCDTKMKEYFYPDMDKVDMLTMWYIAERSSHSRGSTVDLTMVAMTTEQEVDMGSIFDFFGELSHAEKTIGLTEAQSENRRILRSTMSLASCLRNGDHRKGLQKTEC